MTLDCLSIKNKHIFLFCGLVVAKSGKKFYPAVTTFIGCPESSSHSDCRIESFLLSHSTNSKSCKLNAFPLNVICTNSFE